MNPFTMSFEQRKQDLEKMLLEAKRKRRQASEVISTDSYRDFQAWARAATTLTQRPIFNSAGDVVIFFANCLVSAGIGEAAKYFESFGDAEKNIEQALEDLDKTKDSDLGEWSVDSEDATA